MIGLPYKDTLAAKGSSLYEALTDGPEAERAKKAKAIYEATTARMLALIPVKESAWKRTEG
jgi:hypothetical protein